jgi:uncharacterized protein
LQQIQLGSTGMRISRLCFGTLTMGPLQKNLPFPEGARLMMHAHEIGVNFFDTAEIYGTYGYLAILLKEYPTSRIATKCYAYDKATAEKSYEQAVKGIKREYIDIFMLHEQESEHTLRGHGGAIEFFLKKKEEGYIGALGISTHHIAGVMAAIDRPEISVIEAIINFRGYGIVDGGRAPMEAALAEAAARGKGIIAMKVLGGGHLIRERHRAFDYIRSQQSIHSIAVGIQSDKELGYAAAYMDWHEDRLNETELPDLEGRQLIIEEHCDGCGHCIGACQHGALMIRNGMAAVDASRCVTCGYCGAKCPQLCIKII